MMKPTIDRNKFRQAIRRLLDDQIYYLLSDAVEMLPRSKLEELAKGYLELALLRSDGKGLTTLIEDLRAFEKASLRGEFYESFDVNGKNSNELSKGTRAWIAEFERLLGRCVEQAGKKKDVETLQAFEICFSLLQRMDKCTDGFLFFADEGGSWQVGVDWTKVLPAWFECLSPAVGPEEYGSRVFGVVNALIRYGRDMHIGAAKRAGDGGSTQIPGADYEPCSIESTRPINQWPQLLFGASAANTV
jgi:hypothetical protein